MANIKKRGESGKANAEAKPYRLNGGGCYPSSLKATLSALPGLAQQIGRPPGHHKGSTMSRARGDDNG